MVVGWIKNCVGLTVCPKRQRKYSTQQPKICAYKVNAKRQAGVANDAHQWRKVKIVNFCMCVLCGEEGHSWCSAAHSRPALEEGAKTLFLKHEVTCVNSLVSNVVSFWPATEGELDFNSWTFRVDRGKGERVWGECWLQTHTHVSSEVLKVL